MEKQNIESFTATEFLDLINTGEISASMDQVRFIRFITNNYDRKMLLVFLEDIESKIEVEREWSLAHYDREPNQYAQSALPLIQQWQHQDYLFKKAQQTQQKTSGEIAILTEMTLEPLKKLKSLVESQITEVKTLSFVKQINHRATAEEYLKPLSGLLGNERMLTQDAFEYIVDVTTTLICHETLPIMFRQLNPVKLSNAFIRYTFYKLYKHLYPGANPKLLILWVCLIQNTFERHFINYESESLKKVFSTKPPRYDEQLGEIVYSK